MVFHGLTGGIFFLLSGGALRATLRGCKDSDMSEVTEHARAVVSKASMHLTTDGALDLVRYSVRKGSRVLCCPP